MGEVGKSGNWWEAGTTKHLGLKSRRQSRLKGEREHQVWEGRGMEE